MNFSEPTFIMFIASSMTKSKMKIQPGQQFNSMDSKAQKCFTEESLIPFKSLGHLAPLFYQPLLRQKRDVALYTQMRRAY